LPYRRNDRRIACKVAKLVMTNNIPVSMFARMQRAIRLHWPFALLASVALGLLLTNLGSDFFWADEGDTAVLASNILKFGVPKAWDGVAFTDSDKGARVNDDLVMVSHPWVQYYVTAASFSVFGENKFAARLPFALAGWATILLGYFMTWRLTSDRIAAFCAAALMVLSVQFLLYARQCRYYSLNMLLTCCLFWAFFRMKSARSCVVFALFAILLFHTHPFGIVPLVVFGILTLIYRPFARARSWFWLATPGIVLFTLPWVAFAQRGYAANFERVRTISQGCARFVQYLIECVSVAPVIGSIILLIICLVSRRRLTKRAALGSTESAFLLVTFATLLCYGAALAMTESCDTLWRIGIRYTPAILPLMAMVAGILIAKTGRGRVVLWLPLLLIFGFTKLAQPTSWIPWREQNTMLMGNEVIEAHLPSKFIERFLPTEQLLFWRDLWHENPGTIAKTCEFLREHARAGDKVLINYSAEPLYFHTRLAQVLSILPDYPVYEAARRKGLPEYVFSVDRVRWVIWRPIWEGYNGHVWSDVERQIVAGGGRLEQVATVEETVWENRENIHFRRFSGGKYLFPPPADLPAASIFRVDWPD